jgi:hypothetical protein
MNDAGIVTLGLSDLHQAPAAAAETAAEEGVGSLAEAAKAGCDGGTTNGRNFNRSTVEQRSALADLRRNLLSQE